MKLWVDDDFEVWNFPIQSGAHFQLSAAGFSMITMHRVSTLLPQVILALSNGTIPSNMMPRTDIIVLADLFKCDYLDIKLTAPRPMELKLLGFLQIREDSYESPRLHQMLDLLHNAMVSLHEIKGLLKMLVDMQLYHIQDELQRLRVEFVDLMLVFELFNQRQAACRILRRR